MVSWCDILTCKSFSCFSFSLPVFTFPTFRQYHEALENYKNMAQQMKNLNSFIKCLDSVMNQRLQVYADLRRQVVKMESGVFTKCENLVNKAICCQLLSSSKKPCHCDTWHLVFFHTHLLNPFHVLGSCRPGVNTILTVCWPKEATLEAWPSTTRMKPSLSQ